MTHTSDSTMMQLCIWKDYSSSGSRTSKKKSNKSNAKPVALWLILLVLEKQKPQLSCERLVHVLPQYTHMLNRITHAQGVAARSVEMQLPVSCCVVLGTSIAEVQRHIACVVPLTQNLPPLHIEFRQLSSSMKTLVQERAWDRQQASFMRTLNFAS